MRVVIDARESGTSTGRYVDKLVEHLHGLKPNYEFVILTKGKRVEYIKSIAPNFEVVKSDYKEFTFGEQLGYAWQLYKLRPDLVHFAMPQQPVLYFGKIVTNIHDLTTARFYNPAKNWFIFKPRQWIYRGVIRIVAHKSKRIIAISEYAKQDVARYTHINPEKIAVTYPAADKITEGPEPIKKLENKHFLIYVGRAQPHKNLERLIKAFATLRDDYPGLLLVLAGKTDANYARLQLFAEKKGLHGSVVFTGFVPDGALKWLYQNATVYVFPSLSEGFGLPGLEAMQYKLPVVSSNATCLPEIYKDAALYFDPKNTADMAAKIRQVLDDPKLADKLADKGSQLVDKYSWEQMAQQTLDIYKKAAS